MTRHRVIWKFLIGFSGITVVEAPALANVVLAALDPATGGPAIWIELDPDAPSVERRFLIMATGQPIDGDGGYPSDLHVGSMIDRDFVWHIYERRG